MPLDSMPPGEDGEFPNLAEMQPPMAIDIPPHLSLLCRVRFIREPDHKPCSAGCDGHGSGQLCSRQLCSYRCLCYCHARWYQPRSSRPGPPPLAGSM